MTTLSRFGAEASSLVALRTAIDLGEFLAIFGTFAPAAGLARFVTRSAVALRFGEIVDVDDFGTDARNNLLPVDCFHVAQIVVVEQAATSRQDICHFRLLKIGVCYSPLAE